MTKRVLIAILLLMLALSLSLTGYAILQNKINVLGQALDNAVYTDCPAAESFAMIEPCAQNCIRWLHLLTPHEDMRLLEAELDTLREVQNDAEKFRSSCKKCAFLLRDIRMEQRPTLDNIL